MCGTRIRFKILTVIFTAEFQNSATSLYAIVESTFLPSGSVNGLKMSIIPGQSRSGTDNVTIIARYKNLNPQVALTKG